MGNVPGRIPPVPSNATGPLADWCRLAARQLNQEAYISKFSGLSPNQSGITGTPGDLAINVGSDPLVRERKFWMMSGTTQSIRTGGGITSNLAWKSIYQSPVYADRPSTTTGILVDEFDTVVSGVGLDPAWTVTKQSATTDSTAFSQIIWTASGANDAYLDLVRPFTTASAQTVSVTANLAIPAIHVLTNIIGGMYIGADATYQDAVGVVIYGRTLALVKIDTGSVTTASPTYTLANLTRHYIGLQRLAGDNWHMYYSAEGENSWARVATNNKVLTVGSLKLHNHNNTAGVPTYMGWHWVRQDAYQFLLT